ncbi:hypothetical protein DPMN_075824 [Dreissena polymorpha]|uniref:Uncharacterized protein n=1 Tax=Dreissena polymorpha TaxID=45954 RepID=A0A9D3YMG6_DREPO|nr:hypothetical protein DPMN_075824 [Dreissena polymorpha]
MTRFNQTTISFKTIPYQKRTTKVRPYSKQRGTGSEHYKPEKSSGLDNVLPKLIKHGGEATTAATMALCKTIWKVKK